MSARVCGREKVYPFRVRSSSITVCGDLPFLGNPAEYRKNIEEIFPISYEAQVSRKETPGFSQGKFIVKRCFEKKGRAT
ncbi:hypothetical protein BU251_02410 [Candidatus Velamenicoccus archaeovorus]|uniref:Uncharacterized protein n=1 Tax=Velamenicoccus archaeovorus TaxID=1930593 RepID=A0A410P3J4_VELA1|nr:hypothetical protein BU251_02410 [Candidatus Velamenicoccus archaeovorus]